MKRNKVALAQRVKVFNLLWEYVGHGYILYYNEKIESMLTDDNGEPLPVELFNLRQEDEPFLVNLTRRIQ